MCSIILHMAADGVFIAANRDEMLNRAWDAPAEYWPGIFGGRDRLAGGTWAALNRYGVFAALLNREGTLGPEAGKRSRGALPLRALALGEAATAANSLAGLDTSQYRSFNLVIADATSAFLLYGQEQGQPNIAQLDTGVTMITSGAPNDMKIPRIARHLPRFRATPVSEWARLLTDNSGSRAEQLNLSPPNNGFGTVCSLLVRLPKAGIIQQCFAKGAPNIEPFTPLDW